MTINEETMRVPDYVETRLAFRVWRCDRHRDVLCSINAGQYPQPKTWVARAMTLPEGEWSPGRLMRACCNKDHKGGVPDPDCTCGIYATTDLSIVNSYLTDDAPVVGVVELGGRTIPAAQGYRAEAARVAAVLLVNEMFTLRHDTLRKIAEIYSVPALVPHSLDPDDYRELRRFVQGEAF
jgi:hypothetical protein